MNYFLQIDVQGWLHQMSAQLPVLLKAIGILIVGYLVARLLQRLTAGILRKTKIDNRLAGSLGEGISPERGIAKFVFFLLMIFVLLAALAPLGLDSVLDPVRDMAGQFLSTIPAIIGAGIIGFVGYIVAKVVSSLVGMAAGVLERIGRRAGLSPEINLVGILSTVVFVFVFVPFLIAALDALQFESITAPMRDMLATFLGAIPRLFSAVIIIGAFYLGGKFLTGFLADLLAGLGVNQLASRMGLSSMIGKHTNLAVLLANLAFVYILFMGIMLGVDQLGFDRLSNMLADIFELSARIFFGLIILVIGNFIANLAYRNLSGERSNKFLASLARVVILSLFLAISLRQMGLADDIINLAFGLTLGAVAVAIALSFGLGGREAAGEEMKRILNKFHEK